MKNLLFLLLTLTTSSCIPVNSQRNSSFKMTVDAIASNANINSQKYYLYQALYKNDQLQYDEFSQYVDNAMQDSGYYKVSKINNADLIIVFYYGITNPQTSYNLGNTSAAQTYRALAIESSKKEALSGGQRMSNSLMTGFYSGLANSYAQDYLITYYGKWIEIIAYKKNLKEIWKLKVLKIDSSNDLRKYFPLMLRCAQQYIAKNFNDEILCSINDDD